MSSVNKTKTHATVGWSQDQSKVIEFFNRWVANDYAPFGILRVSGAAGSGKTTVLKAIVDGLGLEPLPEWITRAKYGDSDLNLTGDYFALASPTNLAAKRLSEATGQSVQTLHGLTQRRLPVEQAKIDALKAKIEDSETSLAETQKLVKELQDLQTPRFTPWFDAVENCTLVIVDEASMVSQVRVDEILEHCGSILLVGDHCQLSPVNDGVGSMESAQPDFRLRSIHRQTHGSELADSLEALRYGTKPVDKLPIWRHPSEGVNDTLRRAAPYVHNIKDGRHEAMVLCDTNKQRQTATRVLRREIGATGLLPVESDLLRVMGGCPELDLSPREVVQVLDVHLDHSLRVPVVTRWQTAAGLPQDKPFALNPRALAEIDKESTIDDLVGDWIHHLDQLGAPIAQVQAHLAKRAVPYLRCEFASSSTVHAAQGQECDHVLGVLTNLRCFEPETRQRLLYVAASRGRLSASIFCNSGLEPINLDGGRP